MTTHLQTATLVYSHVQCVQYKVNILKWTTKRRGEKCQVSSPSLIPSPSSAWDAIPHSISMPSDRTRGEDGSLSTFFVVVESSCTLVQIHMQRRERRRRGIKKHRDRGTRKKYSIPAVLPKCVYICVLPQPQKRRERDINTPNVHIEDEEEMYIQYTDPQYLIRTI